MTDARKAKHASGRLSSLDLLRFLAASAVMVYHFAYKYSSDSGPQISVTQAFVRHGYLGVEVFFMISGFVILWSAQSQTGTAFVRSRVLRLFPEFWIAVALTAIILTVSPGDFGGSPSIATVIANFSMVPQLIGYPYVDGVYWTLFVELKFYFLLWLLIVAGQVRTIERWLIVWIALSAAGTLIELPSVLRSLLLFPHGTLFAAGGLFFLAFESGWTTMRAVGLLIAFPTASVLAVRGMSGFIDAAHITTAARYATVGVVATAFVFLGTLRRNTLGAKLGKLTSVAGALTYPLYLLHNSGKAIFLRSGIAAPTVVLIFCATVFSFTIAYVVMRIGTGPLRTRLRRTLDTMIARTVFLSSRSQS